MSVSDDAANSAAIFRPGMEAGEDSYAPPYMEIGGVRIYGYVRDGILVVSLDFDDAQTGPGSPFAMYGEDQVPVVIRVGGDPEPVWDALPEDAVSEPDARLLRKSGDNRPVWVLPDWVDYGGQGEWER
jgi:hypothetical protein